MKVSYSKALLLQNGSTLVGDEAELYANVLKEQAEHLESLYERFLAASIEITNDANLSELGRRSKLHDSAADTIGAGRDRTERSLRKPLDLGQRARAGIPVDPLAPKAPLDAAAELRAAAIRQVLSKMDPLEVVAELRSAALNGDYEVLAAVGSSPSVVRRELISEADYDGLRDIVVTVQFENEATRARWADRAAETLRGNLAQFENAVRSVAHLHPDEFGDAPPELLG